MPENLTELLLRQVNTFKPGNIISGKIVNLASDYVLVDIGYKTEGFIPRNEFKDFENLEPGQEIRVMLESLEPAESGLIVLSKEKADLVLNWDRVESAHKNGLKIRGKILTPVKGGFRVDIGIMAFLPASQADLKPIADPKTLVNQVFEFKVIKLDRMRNNIVVSRREILEAEEHQSKLAALEKIEIGQIVKGTVRNIVDYGIFVDIGDLTGLVHINDLSWSRITHPSQVVAVGDQIEVKILKVNAEKAEVALGIKQTGANPWENIEGKYPVGSRIQGKVVNLTDYGAFIKLEDGVEGLLHISELSWTIKVKNPSEILAMGDTVEIQVIALEPEKQKISFSMKALEPNPWETITEKYPVGTVVKGKVYNLTPYGAFVELEKGIEGLLHVKDLDWTKMKHPSEVIKKGDKVEVVVLEVDPGKKRIALGRKQLLPQPPGLETEENEEKDEKRERKKEKVK
ncbi:MAG: 30S ribosomal protein S1 [Candidatus Omnitrophota bacterium]